MDLSPVSPTEGQPSTPFLSVVIPAFNEAERIGGTLEKVVSYLSGQAYSWEVLVVDEPMVGLDPRSMRLVKDLFRSRVEAGATIFMSTHTLAVAEEIADRIGVITNGQLLFLGTVEELRQQLASNDTLEQLFLALTEEEPEAYVSQA